MRLKQVTISGFKSFPSRTLIEFHPGITAIVGPNGCGKTNVIDALRWVMGEQSSRELRGKSMDDFIFNGSNSRRPLGMAEVSTIFEGVKYKNFYELEVKRRFYRSGEGEFFINGLTTRLKDIQNIFANIEIVILNREMVRGLFTSGKDRIREIFEKASEIAKYKIDKNETLSRFEKINQNLSEIELLIGEISKRIGSLKRQASRAKKYFSLKDDYRNISIKIGLLKKERLTESIGEIKEKLMEIENDTGAIKMQVEQYETDISLYHYKISQMNTQLKEIQSIIDEGREKLYSLGKKKAELSGKRTYLMERRDTLTSELKEYAEISEIKVEEINNQQIDIQKSIKSLEVKKSGLVKTLKERENSLSMLHMSLKEIETRMEEKTGRKDDLLKEKEMLTQAITDFKDKLKSEQHQLEDGRKRLNALYEKEGELTEDLDKKKDNLSRALKHIQEINIKIAEEKRNKNFIISQSNQDIKEGMGLIKKKKNKKFIGEIIKVEKNYETSVESALGEFLYAVVSRKGEILSLADYLREQKKGKGVFLKASSDNEDINIPEGSILNFVKEGKELVYPFLSNVFVVDSLTEALDKMDEGKIYVTRDGDIVNGAKVKAGGKEKGKIITNIAQIQGIDNRLKAFSESLKKEEAIRDKTIQDRNKIEKALSDVKNEIYTLNKELSGFDIEVSKKEMEYRNKLERLKRVQNEISALKIDIEENLLDTRNKIKNEIAEENKKIEKISHETSEVGESLNNMNEKNRQLQDIKKKLSEFNAKKDEIERISTHIKDIEEDIKKIEEDIKQKNSVQNQALKEKEDKENELQKLTEKSRELSASNKKNRERLEEMQEREESYRIDLTTLEMERDENIQQIRREFELNINEITSKVEGNEDELMDMVEGIKDRIKKFEPVNQLAIQEYEQENERLEFYTKQRDDLIIAQKDLQESIKRIDKEAKTRFFNTIDNVRLNFKTVFAKLFNGGDANIVVDGDDPFTCDVRIIANPEGKKLKRIDLLSSGENMLLGISLFLAIASLREYSILILDEVDAPLDELNIERFLKLLNEMKFHTQIIIITHNRRTMEESEYIYGITMQEKGVSKIISIKSKEREEVV